MSAGDREVCTAQAFGAMLGVVHLSVFTEEVFFFLKKRLEQSNDACNLRDGRAVVRLASRSTSLSS